MRFAGALSAEHCSTRDESEAYLETLGPYLEEPGEMRSRVALRAPMPVQDVVKPLARPQNDGSGFETV